MLKKIINKNGTDYELWSDGTVIRQNKTTQPRKLEGKIINGMLSYRFGYETHRAIDLVAKEFTQEPDEYTDIILIDNTLEISPENIKYINIPRDKIFKHNELDMKMISTNKAITKNGQVYNLKTQKFTFGTIQKNGYMYTQGYDNSESIHRLVAKTFIPNPDNLPAVDHINENKEDNRVENLRWCTHEQNTKYYNDVQNDRRIKILEDKNDKLKKTIKNLKQEHIELNRKIKKINDENYKLDRRYIQLNKEYEKFKILYDYVNKTEQNRDKNNKNNWKPVLVNNEQFDSIASAAKFIARNEPGKNAETINKEIRKLIKGLRDPWMMYGKYYIDIPKS